MFTKIIQNGTRNPRVHGTSEVCPSHRKQLLLLLPLQIMILVPITIPNSFIHWRHHTAAIRLVSSCTATATCKLNFQNCWQINSRPRMTPVVGIDLHVDSVSVNAWTFGQRHDRSWTSWWVNQRSKTCSGSIILEIKRRNKVVMVQQ